MKTKKTNVAIGFVTGRKSFKNVLNSYLKNHLNSRTYNKNKVSINLIICYDLNYTSTKIEDYIIEDNELDMEVDSITYVGENVIIEEMNKLVKGNIVNKEEALMIFGKGYAMKRNAVLYFAKKNNMDMLIFFDDDEYPIANIKNDEKIEWIKQDVIGTHIENIDKADILHGHHCGYISPIPKILFNNFFTEKDFAKYIETISNDIISWDSFKRKIKNDGFSYADKKIIKKKIIEEVEIVNGMKFISGANLSFDLKSVDNIYPFYNPPGARGEDTFLSTCIENCKVDKIYCYTFHDSFLKHQDIPNGVVPTELIYSNSEERIINKRFLEASIGWIRYKPLLLYIEDKKNYNKRIIEIRNNLLEILPKVREYFNNDGFYKVIENLDFYDSKVEEHSKDFEKTKKIWKKIISHLN